MPSLLPAAMPADIPTTISVQSVLVYGRALVFYGHMSLDRWAAKTDRLPREEDEIEKSVLKTANL